MPDILTPDEFAARYGSPVSAFAQPDTSPPPVDPTMPPGTMPGRMVAQPNAPDASMVPLSPNAQRAQKLMRVEGLLGDRAGVMSQNDILNADPTQEARKAQAKQMGTNAAQLSAKQQAATRVYEALNDLQQKAAAWRDYVPGAFNGATGPWASNPTFQAVTGFTNRGAQAFNTLLHHDIEKLVALYREMPSTGASGGSDAQDANFKSAMGQWITEPDPDSAFAVLQSAKDLIRTKGGLSPEFDTPRRPLNPWDVKAINRYASKPIPEDSPYVIGQARAAAMAYLKAHPTPSNIQQYNAKFGPAASDVVLNGSGLTGGIGPRYDESGNLKTGQ